MSDLSESIFDNNLQVEKAIHVPTMLAGDPCYDLAESIDNGEFDDAAPMLGVTAEDLARARKEEELGWLLRDVTGWLVEVSAPRVGPWNLDDSGNPRSRRLYIGWRVSRWFKAETYEAAVTAAVEWVEGDPDELVFAGSEA